MPEFDRVSIAALLPFTANSISPNEAIAVMGDNNQPPQQEEDPQGYLDWWIEAACRLRYRYADIMQRIASEQKDGA